MTLKIEKLNQIVEAPKERAIRRYEMAEKIFSSSEHTARTYLDEMQQAEEPGQGIEIFKSKMRQFEDFQSLTGYLLLTCFDLLGQPKEWVSFGEWLTSNKESATASRDDVMKQINLSEKNVPVEIAKEMLNGYNKRYGNRSAFFQFMNKVIDKKTKQSLLGRISRKTRKSKVTQYSDKKKMDFLYSLRNEYTHDAKIASDLHGFVDTRKVIIDNEGGIHHGGNAVKWDDKHAFYIVDWPYILFEVLAPTLGKNTDRLPVFFDILFFNSKTSLKIPWGVLKNLKAPVSMQNLKQAIKHYKAKIEH